MGALIGKLLRDVRVALVVVCLLLAAFQCLWAKITERIIGQLAPFLFTLAGASGLVPQDVENAVFAGPGKILRTMIGGETVALDRAMDLMTIGYVHPLMQTLFCIWAIGRAAERWQGSWTAAPWSCCWPSRWHAIAWCWPTSASMC